MRFKAYSQLGKAIKRGDIPPIDTNSICVDCGGQATEYEHRNYFYPLTVDPVCRSCNSQRGEGFPPVKGKPHIHRGVDFQAGRVWSSLSGGSDTVDTNTDVVDTKLAHKEWDDIEKLYLEDMSLSRRLAICELRGFQPKALTRGDLRAEYFKQHDPYFQQEMFL